MTNDPDHTSDIAPPEKGNADFFIEDAHNDAKTVSPTKYYRSKWEDLDRVQTVKLFWKASLVCFAAAFSAATDGYQVTLAGNIIANQGFINQFATTVDSSGTPILAANVLSIWGNIGSLGQWCGMNISPFIADRFGRRAVMLWYWSMLVISVALECTTKSWGVWTVAKWFSFVGIGAMQAQLQMYITEMSPTNRIRGTMLACYNLWWALGQFFGPVALQVMNNQNPRIWRTAIYTQWAQVGIMFIIYSVIPESPWWLCLKGRHEDAMKILRRLNGKVEGYDVEEEYAILRLTVEHEQKVANENKQNKFMAVVQGVDGWRTICTAWVLVVQGTIGTSLIWGYVTYFFILAGQTDPFKITCITSAIGVAGTLFIMWAMDRLGRRVLVLVSYWLCWFCLLFIGVLTMVKDQNQAVKNGYVALACLWTCGMYVSGGVGWAYVGEIPSSRLRSRTAGFGASIATAIGFAWGGITPYMINVAQWNWGLKSCFFYAGVSFFPIVATYFVIPETRGRSPAELDEMFEKKVRAWHMASYVTDVEKERAAQAGVTTEVDEA